MSAPLPEQQQIGNYSLINQLGEGGQGHVYRACRTDGAGPQVALKIYMLPMDEKQQKRIRKNYEREVSSLGLISSEAVVKVIDHGEDTSAVFPYAGRLWIAFELVEGRHLKHMTTLSRPPVERVVECIRTLGEALHAVHEKRVVHRDIKPENVILRAKKWNDPVLVDFGLVKAAEGSKFTRTGVTVGTEGYLAPEVAAGVPATALSDQWSLARLAAMLLLWCSGEDADDLEDDARQLGPGASSSDRLLERFEEYNFAFTAEVLEQALSSDPNDRFETVGDFATAFEEALFEDEVLEREHPAGEYVGAHWDKRKSLATFLRELGLASVVDRRPIGGALWVVAGNEFKPIAKYLAERGVSFIPSSGGATGGRPGWYTKSSA